MTSFQDHDPDAEAQEGDALYEVSVGISDIGAADPEEAAQLFWRILTHDYYEGILGTLFIKVRDEPNGLTFMVGINPVTGEAE